MHVDDLFIGTTVFLDWLIAELKKEYEIGSLEWDDVMVCGQRVVKNGEHGIMVHQDVAIEELNEAFKG
eukprot:4058042-Amphidinium_carterae.1